MFTVAGQPAGATCFTYSLELPVSGVGVSFVSMTTYPTLTIGPTVGGEIGTARSSVYGYRVQAIAMMSGVGINTATVVITIQNECYSAAIAPSSAGVTTTYQILDSQVTIDLSTLLPVSGQPTGIACFTYNIYDASNAVTTPASYVTFSYPTISIGPTAANQIGASPSVTLSYQVGAVLTITPNTAYYSPVAFTVNHECSSTTIATTSGNTISYTMNNPTA